jgi:hypothetical protein
VEWRASVVGLRRLQYHLELELKLELARMPRNIRRCEEFSCSAYDLLAVLTSTELLQEQQRLQGARNVSVASVSRDDRRWVIEVQALERIRNLVSFQPGSGAPSVITYDWDLQKLRCTWAYHGPHGSRLQLAGSLHIEPLARGARLQSMFEVKVSVPLMAAPAERVVEAFLVASYPGFIAAVRRRIEETAQQAE